MKKQTPDAAGDETPGIYRRAKKRQLPIVDAASFFDAANAISEAMDINAQLARIENEMREIVISAGGSGSFPFTVPAEADIRTSAAAEALFRIACVRDWLSKGDAKNAAINALFVGIQSTIADAARFDEWVRSKRKSLRPLQETNRRKGVELNARDREMRGRFKELKTERTRPENAYRIIAKEYNLSVRQVKRIVNPPAKKRQ